MATPPIDKDGGFVIPPHLAKAFTAKLFTQPSLLSIMKKAQKKQKILVDQVGGMYDGKGTFTVFHWDLLKKHGVKSVNVEHDYLNNLYKLKYKLNSGYGNEIAFTPEFIQDMGESGVVNTICEEVKKKFIVMAGKLSEEVEKELSVALLESENQVTVAHGYITYLDPVDITYGKDTGPLTDQVDTLQYQKHQRPGMMRRDMSKIPCRMVAASTKDYYEKWNDSPVKPEHDAVSFYLLNHAVAEVSNRFSDEESMDPKYVEIFDEYHTVLADAGLRLFYYLLLICTREARHINDQNNMVVIAKAKKEFADELVSFVSQLPDGSTSAAGAFMNMHTMATIGEYCKLLCYLFDNGKWSSSFGGKKWGVVADALNKYVHGVYSLQLLLDVGFALAHNGGPIFNKHMLYKSYNGQWLRTILDCQRAGQVPQLVKTGPGSGEFITDAHVQCSIRLQVALGECMGGKMDWEAVKAAGALGNYDNLIAEGAPVKVMGVDLAKDAPESLKQAAKDYATNVKAWGEGSKPTHFEVMPDVQVEIMQEWNYGQ